MTISIITPTHNSASTLPTNLHSITSQSYNPIQHIIIDAQSTDNTLDLVKQISPNSHIISEPDQGIYDAINKGISHSSGEIIGILNSDDFYANENVIEKVMKLFEDPTIDAVYADLDYVHPSDIKKVIRKWRSGPYDRAKFLQGWMPPHPAFFIRKKYYEKYGMYTIDLKISADYELMLRMLYKHKLHCYYLPQVIVHMRTGGISNASFKSRWHANRQDRKAWTMNGLTPGALTLIKKPLQKVLQYI